MISDALKAFLCDEAAFHFAAQDILQTEGGFTDVRLPGDLRDLVDEVCTIQFTRGPATSDSPRGLRPATTTQEYSVFTGTLEVTYGLPRQSNIESLIVGCHRVIDEKRGAIRACFLRGAQFFTVGRLPNHVIDDIVPGSSEQGVDKTDSRERDIIIERFSITYERVMANWPA